MTFTLPWASKSKDEDEKYKQKQKTKNKDQNQNLKHHQPSFVVVQQVTNQEFPALNGQKSSPGQLLIYLQNGSWHYSQWPLCEVRGQMANHSWVQATVLVSLVHRPLQLFKKRNKNKK
jgi:hypothetical protein